MSKETKIIKTHIDKFVFERIGYWDNKPIENEKKRKYGLYYRLDPSERYSMTGCYMFADSDNIFYVGKTDEGFMRRFEHYACLSPGASPTNTDTQ